MSNLINIELFFLIPISQFNNLLAAYNITLNDSYFVSYVVLNMFAYIVLYVIIYFMFKLFSMLTRRSRFNV